MNAPLPEHIARALASVTLDDKYALDSGGAFMSGVQALVRLPMLQRQRDKIAGKNTAGFISGYRGSPLGGYDQALWSAKKYLTAEHIIFQPGVNEELAATAIWGTQQLGFTPKELQNYDGVFGIWYGKGPGVDRCSDVFKHANMAGTTPWGGVLAIAGDDHIAKSSTAAHQSDHIFIACGSPIFFPSSVQDILDLGVHAIAMSRFSGLWSGMKTIQEIVESSATVWIDPSRVEIKIPQFVMPELGIHIRWPDDALSQEARMFEYKWSAALAYIRANKLNFNVIESAKDRFGIVASGKAYNDTRQALLNLGLDDAMCNHLGIRVHKVNVSWPLEPQSVAEFASGLQEILVVEEKRAIIEPQIKEQLFAWPDQRRPRVNGKFELNNTSELNNSALNKDYSAVTLLRASADLNPDLIARALVKRLTAIGVPLETQARMHQHISALDAKEMELNRKGLPSERLPWFCSGCPHNTSTVVPSGSRAMAGIGCHFMALWMDRSTTGFTQMGGEGTPWIGQQPFVKEKHIFANIGDGTYFHSGILAIRQSVAAGVNITYKILFNDAVAMTGGQPIGERAEGHSVIQIAQSMRAEGVRKITIVTDEVEKYADALDLPTQIEIQHRDSLDAVQREFVKIEGTTVIIYDQTCATEKRRRRKRGRLVDPAVRVLINEEVCEGCGDCSEKSNCISIEPLETVYGRKRTINQSTCNKDVSCVKGFCPSFITIEGGSLKSNKNSAQGTPVDDPLVGGPVLPDLSQHPYGYGILVAGVGGTGVITIGQLLGFAAHLEGLGIVTQDSAGLAQKGGATWSHVLIASEQHLIRTTRVSSMSADLLLACDPIVASSRETLSKIAPAKTRIAFNKHNAPTAQFVKDPNWQNPSEKCRADLMKAIAQEDGTQVYLGDLDAYELAVQQLGDSLFVNPIILGFAWQRGWIPLRRESLIRAIELNGAAVEKNKRAFEIGRSEAQRSLNQSLNPKSENVYPVQFVKREDYAHVLSHRRAALMQYQGEAYAARFAQYLEKVYAQTDDLFATTVAKNLYKLMAYKDEYEVARLHTQDIFINKVNSMFEGDFKIYYHLAPPLFAKKNEKGELIKQKMGPLTTTAFKFLKHFKFLRGTLWDPFGYTEERRLERQLVVEYMKTIDEVLDTWSTEKTALAKELANLPSAIKGYGHVKLKAIRATQTKWQSLLESWRAL